MLSIDAGRVNNHMSYNLETPGNGFASRGKGQHIRRIQVPTPQDNYSIVTNPTPRSSSRAQLLAGLRTAPKTPTSASVSESRNIGLMADNTRTVDQSAAFLHPPRTAMGVGFTHTGRGNGHHQGVQPVYSHSSPQVEQARLDIIQNMRNPLPTPPSSSPPGSISSEADYEANIYAGLVAQNLHLAQQQQILQQRVRNVQAQNLQRQLQQLQIQSPTAFGTPPISPSYMQKDASVLFNQHSTPPYGFHGSANVQLTTHHIPQQHEADSSAVASHMEDATSGGRSKSRSPVSGSSVRLSPPLREKQRTDKPMKRGHKKCSSLSSCVNAQSLSLADNGPKTSVPKLNSSLPPPPTPSQSTFGGRGDHPMRQPRGPPSLEEIVSKPTSKHEGSKNFATRQRRRALSKLVNAGIERRVARSSGPGSAMAPVCENEIDFILDEARSTHPLSGRRSSHGLRVDENDKPFSRQQHGGSTPLLVLSAAEKRKSALF